MAGRGEVHADLVRAPGVDAHVEERGAVQRLRELPGGLGRAPPRGARWTSSCGGRDGGRWRPRSCPRRAPRHAVHHREVMLLDRAARELRGQAAVRLVALRDHDEPRRPAVQAVDDPRPQHAAHARTGRARGGGGRSPACPSACPRRGGRRGRPACPPPAGACPPTPRGSGCPAPRARRARARAAPPARAGPRGPSPRRAGTTPSTVTEPSSIRDWMRARLSSGRARASHASSRRPASPAATSTERTRPAVIACQAAAGSGVTRWRFRL